MAGNEGLGGYLEDILGDFVGDIVGFCPDARAEPENITTYLPASYVFVIYVTALRTLINNRKPSLQFYKVLNCVGNQALFR